MIVLDAVSVATIARAARDAAAGLESKPGPHSSILSMLPDAVSTALRRMHRSRIPADDLPKVTLTRYADELDQIAEAALSLDQREHELEHQLRWWGQRVQQLESEQAADIEIGRELALFRGRISGAHAMLRHYLQERAALAHRHDIADTACAAGLTALAGS